MNEQVHKVSEGRRKKQSHATDNVSCIENTINNLKQWKVAYRLCPSLSKCAQVDTVENGEKTTIFNMYLALET